MLESYSIPLTIREGVYSVLDLQQDAIGEDLKSICEEYDQAAECGQRDRRGRTGCQSIA